MRRLIGNILFRGSPTAAVLTLAVACYSLYGPVRIYLPRGRMILISQATAAWAVPLNPKLVTGWRLSVSVEKPGRRMRPYWHRHTVVTWVQRFEKYPMWWAAPALAVAGAAGWRLRRPRFGAGCCSGCGYDRAGLGADAPCPECGRAPGGG